MDLARAVRGNSTHAKQLRAVQSSRSCWTFANEKVAKPDPHTAAGFLEWLASLAYSLGVLVAHHKNEQML